MVILTQRRSDFLVNKCLYLEKRNFLFFRIVPAYQNKNYFHDIFDLSPQKLGHHNLDTVFLQIDSDTENGIK
jgi:hypothetical protein